MGIISFFNKNKAIKAKALPWHNLPSILSFIKSNLDSNGKLTEDGDTLPDEKRRYQDDELRWVAGGLDGAFGHHSGGGAAEEQANKVTQLLTSISQTNKLVDKVELYKILLEDDLLSFIDVAFEALIDNNVSIDPYLHNYSRWLAFDSPDRGPVKFGIALLGLISDKQDMKKVHLLGRHEEFTLFTLVALGNAYEDPELEHWRLAKYVDGWGRIHAVEKLADTENSEIKKWFIREGYKNNIMFEYLAYTCAVSGELKEELARPIVDQKLLDASGDIIQALLFGGPAEDIDDYEDGAEVVKRFVNHIRNQPDLKLNNFLALHSLNQFLLDEESDWTGRKQRGWSDSLRTDLQAIITEIISDPKWTLLVEAKKNTADQNEFWKVDQAATALGLDMWDTHWQRLTEKPTDSTLWYNIMREVNQERINQVLLLALEKIPLDSIATGVDDCIGMGPEYELHSCLDFILQNLGKFPGNGIELITAGLNSPVTRNRNMAIKALSGWGSELWPEGVKQTLFQAGKDEPNEDTKDSIRNLLEGKSIDESL